jgi:hypothetical protein
MGYRPRKGRVPRAIFEVIRNRVRWARRAPPLHGLVAALGTAVLLAVLAPMLLNALSHRSGPPDGLLQPLFFLATRVFQAFGVFGGLLCGGAACLSWLFPNAKPSEVPYIAKALLSPTEVKFFVRLQEACSGYVVGPQIALAAIVDVPAKYNASPQKYANRAGFAQKFADFAIIDKVTGKVHAIVELDDYSHDSAAAQERDARRDAMIESVGIPVFRFDARSMPSVAQLKVRLDPR